MVRYRVPAAAAILLASTVVAQQSGSAAGAGNGGGTMCGVGNKCPESIPCCSRKPSPIPFDDEKLITARQQSTANAAWERIVLVAAILNFRILSNPAYQRHNANRKTTS